MKIALLLATVFISSQANALQCVGYGFNGTLNIGVVHHSKTTNKSLTWPGIEVGARSESELAYQSLGVAACNKALRTGSCVKGKEIAEKLDQAKYDGAHYIERGHPAYTEYKDTATGDTYTSAKVCFEGRIAKALEIAEEVIDDAKDAAEDAETEARYLENAHFEATHPMIGPKF